MSTRLSRQESRARTRERLLEPEAVPPELYRWMLEIFLAGLRAKAGLEGAAS